MAAVDDDDEDTKYAVDEEGDAEDTTEPDLSTSKGCKSSTTTELDTDEGGANCEKEVAVDDVGGDEAAPLGSKPFPPPLGEKSQEPFPLGC